MYKIVMEMLKLSLVYIGEKQQRHICGFENK